MRRPDVGLERRQPQRVPIVPLVRRAKVLTVLAVALSFPVVLLGNLGPIPTPSPALQPGQSLRTVNETSIRAFWR